MDVRAAGRDPLPVDRVSLSLPRGRHLEISTPPLVMGILNITPDSFSDGGVHFEISKAVHSAMQMVEEGAAIIDVGGESTRPGAEDVAADVELERVIPVIEEIRRRVDIPISIDTVKADVAEQALAAGADIVNDTSALRRDRRMAALVARSGVPVILMHMRGEPRTMQQMARYDDVVSEIAAELTRFLDHAVSEGVHREQILVDPGIGFAKTYDHNLTILARCSEFRRIAPVVIGASRKAFIGHLTGRSAGPGRAIGSLAAVAAAYYAGAAVVRVHDVSETIDFLKVLGAIEQHRQHGARAEAAGGGR